MYHRHNVLFTSISGFISFYYLYGTNSETNQKGVPDEIELLFGK